MAKAPKAPKVSRRRRAARYVKRAVHRRGGIGAIVGQITSAANSILKKVPTLTGNIVVAGAAVAPMVRAYQQKGFSAELPGQIIYEYSGVGPSGSFTPDKAKATGIALLAAILIKLGLKLAK